MSRLGLELGLGRLGLGPRVVCRLGSGVWVSASFQIFSLTAGKCPRYMVRKLSRRGNVRGTDPRGECPTFDKQQVKCSLYISWTQHIYIQTRIYKYCQLALQDAATGQI